MKSKHTILLVEDDANLGTVIREHLRMKGFEVVLCRDGEEAERTCGEERFDLLLVDVMLPKKDGFTLVREIRNTDRQTPIIFLTARSLPQDRIEGFRIGCDDYVTKPFSIEELELRIEVALRRSAPAEEVESPDKIFSLGDTVFDGMRRTLCVAGKERRLTPKETELLRLLFLHQGRTLPREIALRNIWGDDGYFAGRSMDVFISKLRKYLRDDPRIEIMGVHGKGFRLVEI